MRKLSSKESEGKMRKILFVNHAKKNCGVYQYGFRIFETIKSLSGYQFDYLEVGQLQDLLDQLKTSLYDAIIYNYFYFTLPFIDPKEIKKYNSGLHICLAHEISHKQIASLTQDKFDYYLYADPTIPDNPYVFKIGRLLPKYSPKKMENNQKVSVGSYGFAGELKGFDLLVKLVQNEFDEATIRINIPQNNVVDNKQETTKIIEQCKNEIKKPGIRLEITQEFLDEDQLLNFLAANTINIFPYHDRTNSLIGIASAPDFAMVVGRPMAISDCYMFRHLHDIHPSIVVPVKETSKRDHFFKRLLKPFYFSKQPAHRSMTYRSIKEIIKDGDSALQEKKRLWTEEAFLLRFDEILSTVFERKIQNQNSS